MGYHNSDKLEAIHLSTRTSFKRFARLHNALRQRLGWYYNWHLSSISSKVHWVIMFFAVIGLIYGFFNFFSPTKAAPYQPELTETSNITQTPNFLQTKDLEDKIETLTIQLSQLAANEVLTTIQEELGDISDISSESTQLQIRDKIESNLAKDNNLEELLNRIGQGEIPNQTVISLLANLTAKVSSEVTLSALLDKMETGLENDASLQASIDKMNKNIGDIEDKLAGTLNTSISNWITSIAISNFPADYPSKSVERGQEEIGSEYFQRGEDFYVWASRKGYGKIVFSGEVGNPNSGEGELLTLAVPVNHTYYLTASYLSSTSSQYNNIKIYYTPKGGVRNYIDRIVYDKKDSRTFGFVYPKKLQAGDIYELFIQGVGGASGASTANLHYIDLPWEE